MHHDHLVAIQVMQKLSYQIKKDDYENCDIVVCAPFTDLRTMRTLIEADQIPVYLGAQNCHWEKSGAFTGEISTVMLSKLNVSYVIVGHSERRQLFGETDTDVNRKAKAVLASEMTPIICVGETIEEREQGRTKDVVGSQTRAAFAGIKSADAARCVMAYEPIWAIGTGHTATSEDANTTVGEIRSVLRELYSTTADAIRIQYGGSVKPGNIAELMAMSDIDGALVGGASLDPDDFYRIIAYRS